MLKLPRELLVVLVLVKDCVKVLAMTDVVDAPVVILQKPARLAVQLQLVHLVEAIALEDVKDVVELAKVDVLVPVEVLVIVDVQVVVLETALEYVLEVAWDNVKAALIKFLMEPIVLAVVLPALEDVAQAVWMHVKAATDVLDVLVLVLLIAAKDVRKAALEIAPDVLVTAQEELKLVLIALAIVIQLALDAINLVQADVVVIVLDYHLNSILKIK